MNNQDSHCRRATDGEQVTEHPSARAVEVEPFALRLSEELLEITPALEN
jgi:hypothetical protein